VGGGVVMKLLENFYMVSTEVLTHRFDATAFLLKGEEYSVLIDCGTPQGYEKMLENIKKCGVKPESIKYVFGTHGHYDHVGAGSLLKRNYKSTIYLHEKDLERVECGDGISTTSELLYGEIFEPFKVDHILIGGEKFDFGTFKMEVIHTPGHTPGGVCYLLEISGLKVLIAGDTLYGGFSEKIGSDEVAWMNSLEQLCERDIDLLISGHMNPTLLGDAKERLKSAKDSFGIYYNPWFKAFKNKYRY
jgi:glyoxylase-like metal-dependent hydrolase (beta-lactamase superfamily II)